MKERVTNQANIYANSLIQSGLDREIALKDFLTIKSIVQSSPELKNIFVNPAISKDKKFEIIEEVFNNQINAEMINFLKIIINKGRFNELSNIHQAYMNITDELDGIKRVEIISAIKLNDKQIKALTDKLKGKFNKNIIAEYTIDAGIIGGLIIKTDDDIMDGSIKKKLDNIRKI